MHFSTLLGSLLSLGSLVASTTATPILEPRAITTFTGRINVRDAANGTSYGYFYRNYPSAQDAADSNNTALAFTTSNVSDASRFTFQAQSTGTTNNITLTYLTGRTDVPRRTIVTTGGAGYTVSRLPSSAPTTTNTNSSLPQANVFSYTAANKTLAIYFNAPGPTIKPGYSFWLPLNSTSYNGFTLRGQSVTAYKLPRVVYILESA